MQDAGLSDAKSKHKKKTIDQRVKKRNCRLSRRPLLARSGITGGIVESKTESGEARDYGGCFGGRQGGVKWDSRMIEEINVE